MSAEMKLPKIALGAWAWGNDGTFGIRHMPMAQVLLRRCLPSMTKDSRHMEEACQLGKSL